MTDGQATTSLAQHVRAFDAGGEAVAAAFLGDQPALALADGVVRLGEPDDAKRIAVHPGAAILVTVCDGATLATGGDDGRVVAVGADGVARQIADEKGRWIDALALRGESVAWSAGKAVMARDEAGVVRTWAAPSSVRGLAFQPKGYRLAATHYNGATLWFPKVEGAPQTLEWKGAHLDATFSPDGRFLVTSMQENALHGWRLVDSRNMRMTGYPGKTRSLAWSHDGNWLATSGAEASVVWPFKDKDGPMGKAPRECGVREARVTRVAFHPRALVLAIGYADGMVLLCRLADAAEILVRRPGGGPVGALCWDARGARLLFGLESGEAGLLDLPG
ncbi:WD-40 repeat-containing protein [Roseiarcus fermentans]|uniref:WD-40 repeat-containing protein n=1 Tax=Roseiarcus fermentans TaxID=1473586 RepID=A0A366FN36_9HYPH|nr:WD40 repeat domain-containing protein [Roseiarcus fermentans]RBP16113.1 WD-40 repeat-containing protein [Roseiarcus fermentans]